MRKSVKTTFLIVFALLPVFGFTQQASIELKNVSVIDDAGNVRVEWDFFDTTGISMGVYKDTMIPPCYSFEPAPSYVITDTSDKSFIDSNVDLSRVRSYIITQTGVTSGNRLSSNKFNTVKTTFDFDTCRKEINLTWTRHFQNTSGTCTEDLQDTVQIKEYNVWRHTDGNPAVKLETVTGDTTYTDRAIEYNHTYKYYVEAVRESDTTIKSMSNRVSIATRMPYAPDYINTDKLRTGEEDINLLYSIADNSELNQYILFKSEEYKGIYDTLKTYNSSDNTLAYSDEETEPEKEIYHYHVVAVNQCGHATTHSDTLNNIIMNVKSQDAVSELSWNALNVHKPTRYYIYRKTGDGTYNEIYSTTSLSYYDSEPATFRGRDSSGTFCYYIKAIVSSGQNRETVVLSNKKCVYASPQIFVPNAFTPNDDGLNDEFRAVISFLPEHFRFIIYNRQGSKVFETSDPNEPWRGRIAGGKKAPGGTYIYYLEVKNPGNKLIKKRGQINVLYP